MFMKRLFYFFFLLALPVVAEAKHVIHHPDVKTLQVVVNDEWMQMPVMNLRSSDVLNIGFDELSHNFHRYICRLEHCEADWTPSDGLFESDWLEGFNDLPIEDYENSLNTSVLYTHYDFSIPNKQCRLKMSGNYRLYIIDEEEDEKVATVEFRVVDPQVQLGLGVKTNTDIGLNTRYQQVSMTLNYNSLRVTNPEEQIYVLVLQNGREDNMKQNPAPNYITTTGLQWEHNKNLIFEGGNEYHKFEVLDVSHPTMGISQMVWDSEERSYHAFPFEVEPTYNYVYNEDADGAFYIRNSDNMENNRLSDYVYVHYKLRAHKPYENAWVMVNGDWTVEKPDTYVMTYDEQDASYNDVILQKQGYYNYQFLMMDADGTTHCMPEAGSFYQTENRYQAFAYYKGTGERTWRLVGYQEIVFK